MLSLKLNKNDWNRVAITSDTHYHHRNIVAGISNWKNPKDNCRPFDTLEEHNQALIDGINNTVDEKGILVHLGDWSMHSVRKVWEFRYALKVREVHLIMGNHDEAIRENKEGCRGAFTTVNEKGIIGIDGQQIILDHYAQRIWWHSNKGNIMLYGHSHGNLEYGEYMKYKTMDVGVDNHPEFRPFLLSEIKQIMDKRQIIVKDHHR